MPKKAKPTFKPKASRLPKALLVAAVLALLAAAVWVDNLTQPRLPTTSTTPVAVTHHWATWCPPCLLEMPSLLATARLHPQVPFTLVSYDAPQTDLPAFFAQKGYTLPPNVTLTRASSTTPPFLLPTTVLTLVSPSAPLTINGTAPWATLFPKPK